MTEQLISANEHQASTYRAFYAQAVPQCEPTVVAVTGVSDAVSLGLTGPILTESKDLAGLVGPGAIPDPPSTHTWDLLEGTPGGFILLNVHGDEALLRRAVTAARKRAE